MSWWFKRHPKLLTIECERLERNGNYNEIQRERDNILVSHGEIIVRGKKTTRHPIIIIYPESTPYSLPIVVLLNKILSKDEVVSLSKKSSTEAIKSLKDFVHFFNYWHQNPDGSLCLLEQDNLETYGEFFSINDVINRTRDWISGLSTGKLPPDSPEVELFAHFRNRDYSKEVIIPESFLNADLAHGEFYCIMMSNLYPNEIRIYQGVLILGENEKGIRTDPIEASIGLQFMPKGIDKPLDLILKPDIVKAEKENKNLLAGYWWDIGDYQIKPVQCITDLAELVGAGNTENGYKRLQSIIGNDLNGLPNELILAIRFSNKRAEKQWQSFTLTKGEVVSPPVYSGELKDFIEIFKNYSLNAIQSAELTDKRHHLRNTGLADRNTLSNKAISIIGCGALGGEISDTVSKAGIGSIALVDNQKLAVDNSVRHLIGFEKIGIAKVHAIQQHILFHNPFLRVFSIPGNIMKVDINDYVFDQGIGISSVANDNVEGYLNEQAIINNKTMFYVRALRGGKVGKIFRVIPGVDACFNCLSLYSDENNNAFTKIPLDEKLPTITNECNNPIRPASAAELKLISSIASKIVLQHLQDGETENNHWIWSEEKIDGISVNNVDENKLVSSKILPHKDCQYCNPIPKIKVEISEEVEKFMVVETQINDKVETGGVLLGKINDDSLKITFASDPGLKAIKEKNRFLKDKLYCQEFINNFYQRFGENAVYIGEWHYHPSKNNKPSNTDLSSLKSIANSKGYLTENPVMIILSNTGELSITVHPVINPFYFVEKNII